jgi:hypothetical protein
MKKVYIVFWADSFDDWEMKKVFSTEEKAEEYVINKGVHSHWYIEANVE